MGANPARSSHAFSLHGFLLCSQEGHREGIWEKAGCKTLSKVPLAASGLKLIGATHNPLLERERDAGGKQEKNNGQILTPCCRRVLQVWEVQCIGNEVETQHV